MAQVVDSMPKKYHDKYDWSTWFDGQVWRLVQGEDFDVSPESFSTTARNAARRHGLKARVSTFNGDVYIQVVGS